MHYHVLIRYGLHPFREELLRKVPRGVTLEFLENPARFADRIPHADALYGGISEAEFSLAKKLQWLQWQATGYEKLDFPALKASTVAVTGINGLLATAVAEHGLALLLALSRQLPSLLEQQRQRVWKVAPGTDLVGHRALIVGAGQIGGKLAPLLAALGMEVRGIDAFPRKVPGFHTVGGLETLDEELAAAKAIFICCPLTEASRGMLDARRLSFLSRESWLIVLSRGGIVDEAALAVALREDRIAGAALDVFSNEPLPADSPLWEVPQLIITPHAAGHSDNTSPRKCARFLENLHAWVEGRPWVDLLPVSKAFQK